MTNRCVSSSASPLTYGLLSGAFRPAEQVCVLRALWRRRGMLLRGQGRHVQHMQKALSQMNIQLANVNSDIAGASGQRILRAIVTGERDGRVLGAMKDVRIQASVEDIAKGLQGNWQTEHLFTLKQALAAFDFGAALITECDQAIEQQLQLLAVHDGEPAKGKKRSRARNAPKFDLRTQLFKMCGVDLTHLDAVLSLPSQAQSFCQKQRTRTVGACLHLWVKPLLLAGGLAGRDDTNDTTFSSIAMCDHQQSQTATQAQEKETFLAIRVIRIVDQSRTFV